MNKEDFILKILSLTPDVSFSPIQIQKLFFLLEKRIGNDAKYFKFIPYHYGPYDEDLSSLIHDLEKREQITSSTIDGIKHYGINNPVDIKNFLDDRKKTFISQELIPFIKSKKILDLCYSIYKEFPDMAKRSVLIKKP
jgi:uncharacterized protein YwgA